VVAVVGTYAPKEPYERPDVLLLCLHEKKKGQD
jgi:hypothetical protein